MNNVIPNIPITIKIGATFDMPVAYTDSLGNPIPLTGYRGKMQIRVTPEASNPPIINLTTENGGIAIDEANGIVEVTIDHALTSLLPILTCGQYLTYDLFIISPSDYWIPLLQGLVYVIPSTTHSSSSSSSSSSSWSNSSSSSSTSA